MQPVGQRQRGGRLAVQHDLARHTLGDRVLRLRALGAVPVVIEATAALATIEAGIHQFLLNQRRQEALVVIESVPHRAGHGEIHVVADHVHQLEGAHAETTRLAHHRVEGGAVGAAFVEDAQGFGVVRPGHPIDDEAGGRAGMHRRLAPGRRSGEQGVGNGLVGGQAGDDLHQRHQRRRVEEMQAGQTLGTLEGGTDGGHRNR